MTAPHTPPPAQKKGVHPSLTLCPAPDLDWSRAGTPASDSFDDIYFSVHGGLDETRTVYLQACGLPERWAEVMFKARPFVIGELGFGTGLNFLAAWQMWKAHKQEGGRLHFVSVEKFPLSKDELTRALESWPELKAESEALLAVWPGRVRGTHVLHLTDEVTLTLCHDDVEDALAGISMQADAWFLDGFTPAKNPAMWSETVMKRVGQLSAAGARVGTFTAAGFVREGLKGAGFNVRRLEGFGRKRHRIEAFMPSRETADTLPFKPIIIGGGIAGASLFEAFARRGVSAVVIDPHDGTAASGNAAAIVKPRLDRQDNPLSRFAICAYLYAARQYQSLGAVLLEGVVDEPQTVEQTARFKALADEPALPAEHMFWRNEALVFPKAQVIDPKKAREALLAAGTIIEGRAVSYRKNGMATEVLDDEEHVLASGSHIIFAAGAGVLSLPMFDAFDLRYSRGQISWAKNRGHERTLTYGGYAIPMGGEMLLGATHAQLTQANPYIAKDADDAYNFETYQKAAGETAIASGQPSRASVRVNTKTTWPFIAVVDDGVFVLTGLGSRGFVFAPLMTDMLAAEMTGEPVSWPKKLLWA